MQLIIDKARLSMTRLQIDGYYGVLISLVIISYVAYLPKHLGLDSWSVQNLYCSLDQLQEGHFSAVMNEAVFSCFSGGRFTRGLIFLAFALTRNAVLLVSPWVNIVAVGFMCITGCKIWSLLRDAVNGNIIIYLCCIIAICNPFFTDWMQFIECQFYYPLSLFLGVKAAEISMGNKYSKTAKWCLSSLCLILSSGLYQISLQFYVLMAICLAVIGAYHCGKSQFLKAYAKKIVFAVSVYAVTAIVQFGFAHVLFQSNRLHRNGLKTILNSLLAAQAQLWCMIPYTKNKLSILFLILNLLLLIRFFVRLFQQNDTIASTTICLIVMLISFLGFYISIFLPQIVSELWFPQRSMVGFWSIPLLITIVDYFCVNDGQTDYRSIICGGLALLLLSNIYSCIRFGTDLYQVNATDAMRGRWIVSQIKKYENENNIVVTNLAFRQDDNPTYNYENTVNSYENNEAAWSAEWNYIAILQTVSGRIFTQIEYPEERYRQLYGDNFDWTFLSDEQISFDGSTAYIAIY